MPDSFGMAFGKSLANSAGSGLVSGGINQLFGALTAKRDYKYWKKRTDYENQLQKEWFNLTNEYNSPEAQRARLEQAGLSPALMFGGSGSGASFGASAADMPNAPSGGGAATSTLNPSYDALSASVIKLNSAKSREADANAGKTDEERKYQEWMNNTLAPKISAAYDLDNAGKAYQNAISRIKATYAEIETLQSLGEQQIRMGEMLANIDKLKSDKALSDRERQQLDIIADEIRSRIKVNNSQAGLNDAKTQTENENRDNIVAETGSRANLNDAKTQSIDAHRDIQVVQMLADIGIKEANIEEVWQRLTDLRNGVPVGNDIKSAFVRFLYRVLGSDQVINGTSYGSAQYNLSALLRDFLDKYGEDKR